MAPERSNIRLEGKLINLREFRKSDAPEVRRYCRDPHVARYTMIPQPYKAEYASEYIRRSQKEMVKGSSINLAIEFPATGEVIGGIALMKISKSNLNAEVGFVLSRRFWGKGFVSEALWLMMKLGFLEMKFRRIYAHVKHPNIASMKVLQKNGFIEEAVMRKALFHRRQWFDTHHFGILIEEYRALRLKRRQCGSTDHQIMS